MHVYDGPRASESLQNAHPSYKGKFQQVSSKVITRCSTISLLLVQLVALYGGHIRARPHTSRTWSDTVKGMRSLVSKVQTVCRRASESATGTGSGDVSRPRRESTWPISVALLMWSWWLGSTRKALTEWCNTKHGRNVEPSSGLLRSNMVEVSGSTHSTNPRRVVIVFLVGATSTSAHTP
eukprot:NODE_9144_length_660_cov_102.869646_g8880_i0.p1 GENE.NODE_9144_length_660_cov_102.869646_g8880_i0~~NODE_9144_length_660_cov_102.869646_g8880_i0.p1  ORF type:complete len:198 (+),score=14.79 NODE_9144_length_660_cov_102.869646_g8880_i0:56-595(+)